MAVINVTPFVDIVLVLLVVLMVSSVHIVRASIEVDLPKAASGGAAVESTLNVVIKQDGALFVEGEPSSDAALAALVRQKRKANPKLQVVIKADKNVIYDRVMHAIDVVQSNGVRNFALDVIRASPSGEQ